MTWLTTMLDRPAIGWWDLVDILVVSILVYEVLKLIRGTRAVQMALGGGVIVGLFYVSRWGHLETMNWLIRNTVGYIVFAVIVLFQSDIRRALAHLGRAPFFRYFAKPESAEESIEELIVAAGMLSTQHIGAILAIERQIGLRNYIEGGIPLDAVLTHDLLMSIVQPSSPLHDGAVIVQNDRIAAAACFLPLTVNPQLSKQLGSRHRAAIGLTEENDSIAIVVSEETGSISIVADGQIERGLGAETLRLRLRALIIQRRAASRHRELRGVQLMRTIWPFRYVGLKFLSLGLALLLWLVVSGEGTVERGLRVPLELRQFPRGLGLESEPPANVDVRVRGSSGTLSRLAAGDVVATLSLRGAQPGPRLFHLTPEQVRVPHGVEVVQVDPVSVALTFERSVSRQVPVVPIVEGKPAPGYVVGKISADPATVEIVGRENSVKRVAEALTEPVSVAGAQERVRETVTIGLQDPSLRLKGPRAAVVTVQIVSAPTGLTVHDVLVRFQNLAPSLTAEAIPAVVAVGLRGSREGLSRVEPDAIHVSVDLAGLGAGQYTRTPHADVTGEIGVAGVDPPAVQVRISRARN